MDRLWVTAQLCILYTPQKASTLSNGCLAEQVQQAWKACLRHQLPGLEDACVPKAQARRVLAEGYAQKFPTEALLQPLQLHLQSGAARMAAIHKTHNSRSCIRNCWFPAQSQLVVPHIMLLAVIRFDLAKRCSSCSHMYAEVLT